MSLRCFRFKVPLVAPILLNGEWVSHRVGVLLNRDGLNGEGFWAEASPLPGFSRETIDDVIAELGTGQSSSKTTSPSLLFALSSLEPGAATVGSATDSPVRVPVNALVQGSDDEIREQCRRLVETGCQAVKLKVKDPVRDIGLVHRLRSELGDNVRIRLDANRRWQYSAAKSFLENVRCSNIEYIEEPLADPKDLETLAKETRVPFALDETLSDPTEKIEDYPNAATFVVKPTMIGGLEKIEQLAAFGKPLVFSAAYESGVGLAQIARLAARFSPGNPAGLDTYSRLQTDVLTDRLNFDGWEVTVPAKLRVRVDALEEIQLGTR